MLLFSLEKKVLLFIFFIIDFHQFQHKEPSVYVCVFVLFEVCNFLASTDAFFNSCRFYQFGIVLAIFSSSISSVSFLSPETSVTHMWDHKILLHRSRKYYCVYLFFFFFLSLSLLTDSSVGLVSSQVNLMNFLSLILYFLLCGFCVDLFSLFSFYFSWLRFCICSFLLSIFFL